MMTVINDHHIFIVQVRGEPLKWKSISQNKLLLVLDICSQRPYLQHYIFS